MSSQGRHTTEELNRQYDNRAAVPEHPRIFSAWAERSARFRERTPARLDLAYGPGARERLDLFPAGGTADPVHVFIHGGYWQAMDKRSFSFVAAALTNRGVAVAIPNYPLCPQAEMDAIVEAVRDACAWLWREAAHFGIDPSRIHVSGHSAGGHLTAMLLATHWKARDPALPADLVKSGIAVSGLFDLEPLRHTYVNDALGLDTESARRLSPVHLQPAAGLAPLVLAVGQRESAEYHRQSADFAATWRRHGVPIELLEIPEANHFTILDALADAEGALLARALRLANT